MITGWYNDEYAKVGGEWKFKSRQITTDSFGPVNETNSESNLEGNSLCVTDLRSLILTLI